MSESLREVSPATLDGLLSTGEAVPCAREKWPLWAERMQGISGSWFSYVGAMDATSTGSLSTDHAKGYIDVERRSTSGATHRYYRYFFVRMIAGRVFQLGPRKDNEYRHHRYDRPARLDEYRAV